jgi:hypothetical protein
MPYPAVAVAVFALVIFAVAKLLSRQTVRRCAIPFGIDPKSVAQVVADVADIQNRLAEVQSAIAQLALRTEAIGKAVETSAQGFSAVIAALKDHGQAGGAQ